MNRLHVWAFFVSATKKTTNNMEKPITGFGKSDDVAKAFLDDFTSDVDVAEQDFPEDSQDDPAEEEEVEVEDTQEEPTDDKEEGQDADEEYEVDGRITEALAEFYDQPIQTADDMVLALGKVKERLTDTEKRLEEETKANETLVSILEDSPDLSKLIQGLASGRNFLEVLEEVVGDVNDLAPDPVDNPEEYHKYMRSKVEREIQLKQEKDAREAQEKALGENRKKTLVILDQFQQSKKIDTSKRNEFLTKIDTTINNAIDGVLTTEFLEMMWKGMNYDVDVVKASAQAKIEGRNEGIVAAKQKKVGDGMPRIKRGATPATKQTVVDSFDRGFMEAATNRNRFSNS
jgi:hypothetical protein